MVGQNFFKVGGKRAFEGATYTKYNKINNNLENFRGARLLPGCPLCCRAGRKGQEHVPP